MQDAREPDTVDCWSEPQGLPTPAGPTGLHSEVGRPEAALGHPNDPGPSPSDARQDGAGTRVGDALRDEQLWVPTGTVHDGRDRRPARHTGSRWCKWVGARRGHFRLLRQYWARTPVGAVAGVHHHDPTLAESRRRRTGHAETDITRYTARRSAHSSHNGAKHGQRRGLVILGLWVLVSRAAPR